jgi:hypothetical protein
VSGVKLGDFSIRMCSDYENFTENVPPSTIFFGRLCVISLKRDTKTYNSGVALGCELDDRGVRVPTGAENFFLHHCVQAGPGAHPASYPMGSRGCSVIMDARLQAGRSGFNSRQEQ